MAGFDRLRVYSFGVHGASPGIGGVVVVVAYSKTQAERDARREIFSMNEERRDNGYKDQVSLGGLVEESIPLPAHGVVYSYDGEA